jgi:hypothetical protein
MNVIPIWGFLYPYPETGLEIFPPELAFVAETTSQCLRHLAKEVPEEKSKLLSSPRQVPL